MSRSELPVFESSVWRVGQGVVFLGFVGLLVGLWAMPETALKFLWFGFIPLVPAVLLVSPSLWRNVCPLATLNVATGRRWGRRTLSPSAVRWSGAAGMALLLILIPARKLLLDTNGTVLLGFLLAVGAAALVLGLVFDAKAGFCNAICPVLPVERLYGQLPWYQPANPRCPTCTVCSQGGCLDLDPTKVAAQTLGPSRKTHRWIFQPFGAFALSFPGVITGFFTIPEAALASVAWTYLHVGAVALISFVGGALVVLSLKLRGELGVGLSGAVAFALYYWLGAPTVVAEMSLPTPSIAVIRAGALILIFFWLRRFLLTSRTRYA